MSPFIYLLLVVALAVLILYLRRRHLFTDVAKEWEAARAEARTKRAASETGEPLSEAEAEEIIDWYQSQVRPAVLLKPDPEADPYSAPVRIGGSSWFADGEDWPAGSDGRRLEFVAQVDFSRLPPLDGFPGQGVARFFVGRDDLWGANWDEPDKSGVRVLWHGGPQDGGRREEPEPLTDDHYSPFQDDDARADGVALRPEAVDDLLDYYSWQLQERLERDAGRPGMHDVEDRLYDIAETKPFAHRIGGYPNFTQYDFRERGKFDDLDVLLLGLSSDNAIMWGDVGEAGFYIRREDLERRDFSRVAFYWDCY